MITIPSLSDVTDILDTDLVMVTNSQGQSYKIAGSELNKRHKVIIASSTTVTGTPLKSGWPVRIYFTADITAANANTTMQIKYNNVNYYVKVPKNGALANYVAFNLGGSPAVFKYVQAYTTLELLFDGTQFIIMCNPVVISGTNFSIYADGLKRVDEVTENGTDLVTSHAVAAAIDKVKDIMGALPTDAVLHYSFDEVPDYPDGTADVRLLNYHTYEIQSTNAEFKQFRSLTVSNSNGNAVLTASADSSDGSGAFISTSAVSSKIVKMKIKVTALNGTIDIGNGKGTGSEVIASYTTTGIYEFCLVVTSSAEYPNLYIATRGANESFTAEVIAIYIGNGTYSTPIIDNANGEWNSTSASGVAVKGVSGKAIRFLGNNYIKGNLPWKPHDKKVFTVSGWFKNWDKTTNLHFINDWITQAVANFMIELDPTDTLSLAFDVPTDDGCKRFGVNKTTLNWNNYSGDVFLTGVFNGDNSKFYVNGINFPLTLRSTASLSDTIKSRDVFEIGRLYGSAGGSNGSIATIDDLLIFDRALTENEVMALYLNRANTPKYYPPAQLPS